MRTLKKDGGGKRLLLAHAAATRERLAGERHMRPLINLRNGRKGMLAYCIQQRCCRRPDNGRLGHWPRQRQSLLVSASAPRTAWCAPTIHLHAFLVCANEHFHPQRGSTRRALCAIIDCRQSVRRQRALMRALKFVEVGIETMVTGNTSELSVGL